MIEGSVRGAALSAEAYDVDMVGVVAIESTSGTPLYESARALLPGAKSLVVFAAEVYAEVLDLVEPEKLMGEASARDLYAPHLDYLNGRMNRAIYDLARSLRREGYRAVPMPSVGTPADGRFQRGILSFKHAAEIAGLGRIGWSSLLVTPQFGPRVRLACLLTDAELEPSTPIFDSPCNGCGLCVERCPAGAISAPSAGQPYAINKFACCAYRAGAGACSTCMQCCPSGRG